jgi:hypothetical protein
MSLKPQALAPVPELTAQVAHTAFPDGNPYLLLRDQLGTFYDERLLAQPGSRLDSLAGHQGSSAPERSARALSV